MALRALLCIKRPKSIFTNTRYLSETAVSEYAKIFQAEQAHAGKSYLLWKRVSMFVVVPALTWCLYNTYVLEEEHNTHPRQEFEPYDHLRIRKKPFPWGDGNHTLFHNPQLNALPEGYEEM
ncbi:Cytochrome c oxidase subunit 6A2, mitochondrial-like [Oopsacas minuta]|uniref:Cytochrome c oxidase subunit n=1 Tax=Oopsacas minuta TaxID=111878 RepID=A0AAV7KKN7_9METZ|nr:Cytochrome c oxidase subunit 6A2, mitochondrial-like [Oopsacas minuta]